jgi:hypothetical protein
MSPSPYASQAATHVQVKLQPFLFSNVNICKWVNDPFGLQASANSLQTV